MNLWKRWISISLILRIMFGFIIGVILALYSNIEFINIFGKLFISSLKAIAPLLVFFTVVTSISKYKVEHKDKMKKVIFLYLLGTFISAFIAVVANFVFKLTIKLDGIATENLDAPEGINEILLQILNNIVQNPIKALIDGNFIGILFWAILFGICFREVKEVSKDVMLDISIALSDVVKFIIEFAPFGVMGVVYSNIKENSIEVFKDYILLIFLLVGTMLFMALIVNPLITFIIIRKNPYPLVIKTLKDSGITAFFTRSSIANISVNLKLCKELGVDKEIYAISIPLGATINMGGAAITITILTLVTANTLGIEVDFLSAILLSVLATFCACGASGVSGGSLLLIPLACSLFGINQDISSKVISIGFIIGVIQDSCETALNSSTDVLYTVLADYKNKE